MITMTESMTKPSPLVLGIDFGTTNSVISALDAGGASHTIRFGVGDTEHDVFRSVLCFWQDQAAGRLLRHHAAGPAAIAAYLDDPLESRLVMSPKTYLASASFTSTNLLGQVWSLERLIGLFPARVARCGRPRPGRSPCRRRPPDPLCRRECR